MPDPLSLLADRLPSLGPEADLAAVERAFVEAMLEACGGRKAEAAARLGISLKTLYNWINRWEESGASA